SVPSARWLSSGSSPPRARPLASRATRSTERRSATCCRPHAPSTAPSSPLCSTPAASGSTATKHRRRPRSRRATRWPCYRRSREVHDPTTTDPSSLSLVEVRSRRNELQSVEDAVSYARRVAQTRLDLVRRRLSDDATPLTAALPDVLGRQVVAPSGR